MQFSFFAINFLDLEPANDPYIMKVVDDEDDDDQESLQKFL